MTLEDFFDKYGDDEQMMSQIFAASKDENTLRQFLSSHGVEVAPAFDRKKELCDEELSEVAGGSGSYMLKCLSNCELLTTPYVIAACKESCKQLYGC